MTLYQVDELLNEEGGGVMEGDGGEEREGTGHSLTLGGSQHTEEKQHSTNITQYTTHAHN